MAFKKRKTVAIDGENRNSVTLLLIIVHMNLLHQIPSWLKNKYLLAVVAFVVWMLFFDDRDIYVTYFKQRHELKALEESKRYYEQQIALTKNELDQLKINTATIEKYAREKYLMKRDNEDLFIIEPPKKESN
jgi:cell division protein DivIC